MSWSYVFMATPRKASIMLFMHEDSLLLAKLAMTLVVLLFWALLFYIYKINGTDISKSVSKHIAATQRSHKLFRAFGSAGLIAFYLLMILVFAPSLEINTLVIALITVATAAQLIAAWIPDVPESTEKHAVPAFIAALSYPIALLGFSFSPLLSESVVVVLGVLIASQLLIISLFVLKIKMASNSYLILQSIYIALWHAGLLATIFSAK